jgi:hypothetical protein
MAKRQQLGILQIWSGEMSTPALHVSSAELDGDGCPEILLGSRTWHLLDRGCRRDAPWRQSPLKLGHRWASLLALQGGGAGILAHDTVTRTLRLECGRIGPEGWETRDESSVNVAWGFDPVAASWDPSTPGQLVVAANGVRHGLLVYATRDCALELLSHLDTSMAQIFDFQWIGPPEDRRACLTVGATVPLPWVECATWSPDLPPRYQELWVGWAFAPDLLITPESHMRSTSQLNRVDWTRDDPNLDPLPPSAGERPHRPMGPVHANHREPRDLNHACRLRAPARAGLDERRTQARRDGLRLAPREARP